MSTATRVHGYNSLGQSVNGAVDVDLQTIRKDGDDVAVYTAEFLAGATVIHASPNGTTTGNGSELDPVGPTINDAIALINSRPAGGFVLELAPGEYDYSVASASVFTTARPTYIKGTNLPRVTFTGISGSEGEEFPVYPAGAESVELSINATNNSGDPLVITMADDNALPSCVFRGVTISQPASGVAGEITIGGSSVPLFCVYDLTISTSATGRVQNAQEVRGVILKGSATITATGEISNVFGDGAASISLGAKVVKNVHITGSGSASVLDFESLHECLLNTSGAIALAPLSTAANAVMSHVTAISSTRGGLTAGAMCGVVGGTVGAFDLDDCHFEYTGAWAETSNGGMVSTFIRLNNATKISMRDVTFKTPTIAVFDGFWNASLDAGQPTQDRYLSMINCTAEVTFANTANPPEDPVTPFFLMSRSDTGKVTYDFHNVQVIYDGSATQMVSRGAAAFCHLRGAGSGGANGSATPVTGNTWMRATNCTVFAKFPAGEVTNGGKAPIIVQSGPFFSEQATILDPILDIDGFTIRDRRQRRPHLPGRGPCDNHGWGGAY
jgi:hypothetical protein